MKAVIFDMDGVLIDSQVLHNQAKQELLLRFGLSVPLEELKAFAGSSRAFFQATITRQYGVQWDWSEFYRAMDERVTELLETVQPIPGAMETLDEIKHLGLKLGLATSSQKPILERVSARFQFDQRFDVIVCANDVENTKPDPEIFLLAAERLRVLPAECAVVEDSLNGVRAAKAAGMYTVAITTTFPRYELQIADRVIQSFDEIAGYYFLHVQLSDVESP